MTQELKAKLLRYANEKEPFSAYNHLEICDVEEGRARIELTMRPESRNRWGQPHGAILFALADVACGIAMAGLRQETCVTVSASMDYMAAAGDADRLIARGEVTHEGRRTCFCRAEITTAEGRLIAACRSVWTYTGHPLPLEGEFNEKNAE